MADDTAFYRTYLKTELQRRKTNNPRYSMRAFAASLHLNNGYLSKIMSGKMLLTTETAHEIAQHLKLNPSDRNQFIISAAEEQKCNSLYGIDPSLTDCDEEC